MQLDEETYTRYEKDAPALLEAAVGQAGERIMKRDAKSDYCVKFDNGLCAVQNQYGVDFLGDACHFYPRMTLALGDRIIMTGALSCPEVVRLALFGQDSFVSEQGESERLPHSLRDYLPGGMSAQSALDVHNAFILASLDNSYSPPRNFMRIMSAALSLERISQSSWPEAAQFYLSRDSSHLLPEQPKQTDPFFLLQALCGLVAAAKKAHQERLMHTINLIEKALHCTIRWDTLAIGHLPDSAHAAVSLEEKWHTCWSERYTPLLRHYLAAQLSLALFPFGGLGGTLAERATIIGVRFATIRLALMSACRVLPQPPEEADCVRIVQSLSRLLDHLAEPEFSLQIYNETGWTNMSRLRAIVGDKA